jgi:hypothetical protein
METSDLALYQLVVRADSRASATLIDVRCGARYVDLTA